MLFRSNGKFVDEVTDSFSRFGIKTKLAEKGNNKAIQKFQMFDDIHNSNYVAIGMDKPTKDPKAAWENIIKTELVPTLNNPTNKDSNPASALIVPSKDIEIVEELLRKKGLSPSVYQLFPGFVVAGISKDDTSSLLKQTMAEINDLEKKIEEESSKPKDDLKNKNEKQENKELPFNETSKKNHNKENSLADVLNALDNDKLKDNNKFNSSKNKKDEDIHNFKHNKNKKHEKNSSKEDENKEVALKGKKSPIGKKLLAAALLGTTIGAGAIVGPEAVDKIKDLSMPKNERIEKEALKGATDTYFQDILEGSPEDKELLRIISENPNLAQSYINELADSPIKVNALKNPSISNSELLKNHNSNDPKIRASVAENPSTPQYILDKLMNDNNTDVLESLATNPALSEKAMNQLSTYSGLHNSLLENPSLKPNNLSRILSENRRTCDFNKLYMSNPCLTIEEIIYHKNNPDECVQAGLASNPNTPGDILHNFSKHKNPEIRHAALKNKNLPNEVLSEIFQPEWVSGNNGDREEKNILAALENPKINPKILEKASFINSDRYNKAIARNKSTPEGLANKIKNYAQGNNGVNNFLKAGNNIAVDPVKLRQLENQMRNNGNLEAPLKRMINKDFAEKVYDPYTFINDMRKLQPKEAAHKINSNNSDNSVVNNYIKYSTPTVLNKATEAPADFSKLPLPPISQGDTNYNPEAEMQALSTANNIVNDLMKDVIADVRAAINNPSYNPSRGDNNNFGNNNTANINTGNNNGSNPTQNLQNNSNINPFQNSSGKKPSPLTYKNACNQIESMYKMF